MYYRGADHMYGPDEREGHERVVCVAESVDGIEWTRPGLGLVEFDGSTDNNIILKGPGTDNFVPFQDGNPEAAPDALYKAVAKGRRGQERGLYAYKSADGVRWTLMADRPVVTDGFFDSQNLAFWDAVRGEYREYHRDLPSRARLQGQQERPRHQDRRDQGLPRLARPGVDQLLAGPDERAVYQPGEPVLPGAPPVPGVPDALRGPGLDRVDEVVAAPGVQAVSSDELGAGGHGRHRRDVDVEQRRLQLRRMAGVVQQARAPYQRQLAVRRQLPEPGAH